MGELLTEPGVTFYLLMTRPLWAAFEGAQAILADLQARWTILANPSDSVERFTLARFFGRILKGCQEAAHAD